MNKSFLIGSVLAVALVGGVEVAQAGQKLSYAVSVNTVSRYALGALGLARNSADAVQYIGCQSYFYTSGAPANVSCTASTAAGVTAACSSSDPNMVAAVDRLQGDSLLRFDWDATGQCVSIFVGNTSQHAPKGP